ncbi:unnamed protein product [Brassica oleracea]
MPPFITDMEATIYTFQVIVSTYNFTAIRHSPSRTFSMNVTVPDIVDNVKTGGSSGEAALNGDTDPVGATQKKTANSPSEVVKKACVA